MGALWSKKGNSFALELEKLEKSITQTEHRQKTAHTNKRRFVAYLIYIAVLAELVIVSWYYFHKKPIRPFDRIIDGYPLTLPPLIGYLFSKTVSFYYSRRIKSDEARLSKLRAQLKQKLEERKKATEFDATQQLLSKYEKLTKADEGPASPKGGTIPQPQPAGGKKGHAQQHQHQQNQHNQQQQQIRQRNPQQPSSPTSSSTPLPPFGGPTVSRPAAPPQAGNPPPSGTPRPPLPTHRSWLDKLVDYVVGGEPEHSFALICSNCKAHNGLIPQSEMQSIQFRCRFCNHFNQTPEGSSTPSSAPTSSSSSSAPSSSSTSDSSSSSANPKPSSPKK